MIQDYVNIVTDIFLPCMIWGLLDFVLRVGARTTKTQAKNKLYGTN
jgi:hypothetical protein